jgi:hypothetical protein
MTRLNNALEQRAARVSRHKFWTAQVIPTKRKFLFETTRDEMLHSRGTEWRYLTSFDPPVTETEAIESPLISNVVYIDARALEPTAPGWKGFWRGVTDWAQYRPELDTDQARFLRDPSVLRREFEEQRVIWQSETAFLSSFDDIVYHPAYLRIIGMGPQVLPLIFEQMKAEPGHWFVALEAITGAQPVEPEADFMGATHQWIEWGRAEGYTE